MISVDKMITRTDPVIGTNAVSGSGRPQYYTIPPGEYKVGPFLEAPNKSKFSKNGVGFKTIISPDPYDPKKGRKRSLLRIHPARFNGTDGCIGLTTEDTLEMVNIERYLKISLDSNKIIPLNVIINGY